MKPADFKLVLFVILGLTLFMLLEMGIPSPAEASWRVVPIRIDLSARNKTGSVKVINEGDSTLRFQLKASRWLQDDDAADKYEDTEDIVFFPRILTIPPGEERLVRAGYKVPATEKEKTYRLFIEQIPEKSSTSAAQVSILIRFGVPVFSAPLQPKAKGEITDISVASGNLEFTLQNTGNVNFQVHSIAAKGLDAAGEDVFTESVKGWYLLTGHQRHHSITLPADTCGKASKLELLLKTDKLDFSRVIELGPGQCGH